MILQIAIKSQKAFPWMLFTFVVSIIIIGLYFYFRSFKIKKSNYVNDELKELKRKSRKRYQLKLKQEKLDLQKEQEIQKQKAIEKEKIQKLIRKTNEIEREIIAKDKQEKARIAKQIQEEQDYLAEQERLAREANNNEITE
ncbi:MAG: hypothetical protein RLZZ175_3097 [Bacteroidota bacterium]|jgi:hypothetical protein